MSIERRGPALATTLVHAGEPEPRIEGAVVAPIFQSSTFLSEREAAYDDIRYVRLSNTPNHHLLHAKLAAIEGGEAALVAGSGMAAITTSLLAILRPGDHLLVQRQLYGGTHAFVHHDLTRWGVRVDSFDPHRPADWPALVRPDTRAIYSETITNPLVRVGELDAIAAFARAHGLVSLIDNTFASPVNFRPLEWGFDLSLHSATKYLNGHSDIAAGAVIGSAELVERVRHMLNHLGGMLDPHACFLLHRGLKTLLLRVSRQNDNALRIARFLEGHDAVATVYYPGLESSPDHATARRLLDGFGGMLAFEVRGDVAGAEAVMQRLRLPLVAPSLGGVETLVTRPAATSHSGMSAEERRQAGVADTLIRMSVGIEAADDLIADLEHALAAA